MWPQSWLLRLGLAVPGCPHQGPTCWSGPAPLAGAWVTTAEGDRQMAADSCRGGNRAACSLEWGGGRTRGRAVGSVKQKVRGRRDERRAASASGSGVSQPHKPKVHRNMYNTLCMIARNMMALGKQNFLSMMYSVNDTVAT